MVKFCLVSDLLARRTYVQDSSRRDAPASVVRDWPGLEREAPPSLVRPKTAQGCPCGGLSTGFAVVGGRMARRGEGYLARSCWANVMLREDTELIPEVIVRDG